MGILRNTWESHRTLVLAALSIFAALVFAAGLYVYLERRPPSDVSGEDSSIDVSDQAAGKPSKDWPLYGLNPERTRHLDTADVNPPFKVKWRFNGRKLLEYSPIVAGKQLFGINNNGQAFSLKKGKGKVRWRQDVASLNASSPAFDDGTLYVANLEPGQIQALNAKNGVRRWKRELPGRTESSPVVVKDMVIVGCECGTLFAFDKKNGKTIWEADIGSGEIKAAPAVSEGVAYVGDYGGNFTAVRINDGSIKWSYSGAGDFYSTAAVAFGRVYVASKDSAVYSFDKDTGDLTWRTAIGGELYAGIAAADTPKTEPTVYLGQFEGSTFFALDARTGAERWTADAGGPVIGAASVIGETVYVANLETTETSGFDVADGEKVWSFRDGAYNPVISDGNLLYLTGKKQIYAMKPMAGLQKAAGKKGGKKKAEGPPKKKGGKKKGGKKKGGKKK